MAIPEATCTSFICYRMNRVRNTLENRQQKVIRRRTQVCTFQNSDISAAFNDNPASFSIPPVLALYSCLLPPLQREAHVVTQSRSGITVHSLSPPLGGDTNSLSLQSQVADLVSEGSRGKSRWRSNARLLEFLALS